MGCDELLNANDQFRRDDSGELYIVSEATGKHADFVFDNK
jgi:hypothetical protein